MDITVPSFISSSISISILIGLLAFVMKKNSRLSHMGLGCVYFFAILILVRGFMPIEFYSIGLTKTIYSYRVIPFVKNLFTKNLFVIGPLTITLLKICIIIWGIGAMIHFIKLIHCYLLSRKLFSILPQIVDKSVLAVFRDAYNKIQFKDTPIFKLIQSDLFSTPAIYGIRQPIIILPSISYTKDELYYIFQHEMLHYKHKDFAFKLCMDFLLVIHWWNPLLTRFSFPIMNQLQELLVDYELTQTMRDEQKAQYMQTLTKTLRYSQETLTKPAELLQGHISALADNYTRKSILQRIKYIVQQPEKRFSLLGATLSLFLFGASFTVVFEASYMNEKTDDNGNQIYYDIEGQTYYVKNGDSYDLYMQNKYVCTTSDILETFKGVPVYDRLEEVPEDEK